jgi:hypothetical protein
MSRRIELVAGTLAGIAVLAALVVLAIVPWSEGVSCTAIADPQGGISQVCSDDRDYVWDQEPAAVAGGAALLLVLTASITGGAWRHVRSNSLRARSALWFGTAVAVLLTLLSLASVGVIFAPATIFAIVASAAAGRSHRKGLGKPIANS